MIPGVVLPEDFYADEPVASALKSLVKQTQGTPKSNPECKNPFTRFDLVSKGRACRLPFQVGPAAVRVVHT